MNLALLLVGILSWIGVGALAIGMAEWDQPLWGFFPILAAVVVAWAIGESVSRRFFEERQ